MRVCWACKKKNALYMCEYAGGCGRAVCPDHMVDLGDVAYCEEHAYIVQDAAEASRVPADYDY